MINEVSDKVWKTTTEEMQSSNYLEVVTNTIAFL